MSAVDAPALLEVGTRVRIDPRALAGTAFYAVVEHVIAPNPTAGRTGAIYRVRREKSIVVDGFVRSVVWVDADRVTAAPLDGLGHDAARFEAQR